MAFSGLNPIYSRKDLEDIEAVELNRFSSQVGLTGQVLTTGTLFYSDNPRGDPGFVRQYDAVCPVASTHQLAVLYNLTIVRLEAGGQVTGVIQVMNREPLLDRREFLVLAAYQAILAVLGRAASNVVEVYRAAFKTRRLAADLKDAFQDFDHLLAPDDPSLK